MIPKVDKWLLIHQRTCTILVIRKASVKIYRCVSSPFIDEKGSGQTSRSCSLFFTPLSSGIGLLQYFVLPFNCSGLYKTDKAEANLDHDVSRPDVAVYRQHTGPIAGNPRWFQLWIGKECGCLLGQVFRRLINLYLAMSNL